MKKRILFVDDEGMVLQGLRRMLHPLREEWEMDFADSGAKALELMAVQPFDVVVSDMRMPGMSGAELLGEVMARHPKTVRLILSGQSEKDLIMKCVGATHQFLAKPCEPEALKATIARATSLDFHLSSERVRTLVSRMNRLPSMPSLYLELTKLLADEDVSLEQIGEVISRDIAMTAQILKLVNSAFFGLPRELATPGEAVSYLGVEILKALALALNVFSQFNSTPVPGFSVEDLRRHSLSVAAGARKLARCENADVTTANESFTAGVLHDAGQLVLLTNFPAEYVDVAGLMKTRGLSELDAEREVFGTSHVEVGGYLFGLWGLPVPVVEAIGLHHQPGQCVEKRFGALTTVHVANALLGGAGKPAPGIPSTVDETYLREAGVLERLPAWQAELENYRTLHAA